MQFYNIVLQRMFPKSEKIEDPLKKFKNSSASNENSPFQQTPLDEFSYMK